MLDPLLPHLADSRSRDNSESGNALEQRDAERSTHDPKLSKSLQHGRTSGKKSPKAVQL